MLSSQKIAGTGKDRKLVGMADKSGNYSHLRNFDAFMSVGDDTPSAMSEKEQVR